MSSARFMMIPGAPTPVAPFSHAVEVDGWVFLTGQMPTDPNDDRASLPVGIEAQTRRVMDNLVLVLTGAGLGLEHVVVTVDRLGDQRAPQILFGRHPDAEADEQRPPWRFMEEQRQVSRDRSRTG